MPEPVSSAPAPRHRLGEVGLAFLKLGLTSFGGPIAHLGYFRSEFVERRRWLGDAQYADLVALCQFLPGPASSQVGMALGMLRAGWGGALVAWLAFTLPSALLLLALALGAAGSAHWLTPGVLHGLKIVAVAVVAQAVHGMGKNLCPDRPRAGLAVLCAALLLLWPGAWTQGAVIAAAAATGYCLLPPSAVAARTVSIDFGISRTAGAVLLMLFLALLVLLPLAAWLHPSRPVQAAAVFYQAGSLVFGGGHVVLPLLQAGVVEPGWIDADRFLAGYAAAQAVPGPLFTLAAYLGAVLPLDAGLRGWPGGLLALVCIFVPAALLVLGALPFWESLRGNLGVRKALAGINAAVVGILAAALYDPVWTSAIHGRADMALALLCFGLLVWGRAAPISVVGLGALAGALFL